MADLAPLVRLGRWQVDELRRQLGALLAREDEVTERRAALDRELAEQQAAARDAMGAGLTFAGYLAAHGERCQTLDRALAALRAEIAATRERIADAYRRLKSYELVMAARRKRAAAEAARKEQGVLDEIGQTLHRRRQMEEGEE